MVPRRSEAMEFYAKVIAVATCVQVFFLVLTIRTYRWHGEYLRLIQNSQTVESDDESKP
jgi:hypothetical protein